MLVLVLDNVCSTWLRFQYVQNWSDLLFTVCAQTACNFWEAWVNNMLPRCMRQALSDPLLVKNDPWGGCRQTGTATSVTVKKRVCKIYTGVQQTSSTCQYTSNWIRLPRSVLPTYPPTQPTVISSEPTTNPPLAHPTGWSIVRLQVSRLGISVGFKV